MDTLYLKRNRLGCGGNDVEALKGLLECPTISCLDISENYLKDPAIFEEVLLKMPNLAVLYTLGNDFVKHVPAFRKTCIARIPTLRYLDDRPVFEEDRRRAEAYLRGGMDEERAEMKLLKKEKDEKHWANHNAFRLMVSNARKEKEEREAQEATKDEKKLSMKEIMA